VETIADYKAHQQPKTIGSVQRSVAATGAILHSLNELEELCHSDSTINIVVAITIIIIRAVERLIF